MNQPIPELDKIADIVLAYRPLDKKKKLAKKAKKIKKAKHDKKSKLKQEMIKKL